MEYKKGISRKEFQDVKMLCSNWYDDHRLLPMLKVLFRDILDNCDLEQATKTIYLLNKLYTRAVFTPKDLTILGDIISLTGEFELQEKIQEYLPSFPDVKVGRISTKFSSYRKKLMKFGRALDKKSVEKIDEHLNSFLRKYDDAWSMITDLENRMIIKEGNMKEFICSLEPAEINNKRALEALTGDIRDPSLDRPTGEPIQKPESSSNTYKVTSGICLIINNSVFQGNKLKSLKGYDRDEESLEKVFKNYFGFDVDVRRNLKTKEIENAIDKYSQDDYTTYDCFICCILSHGNEGIIAGSDCEIVNISRITDPFRSTECEGLVGKPKLFFIQACRGDREPGYVAASADETPRRLWPDDVDFLFGYSTVKGNHSFVSNAHGSPYIQNLTKALIEEEEKNICNILTSVTGKVSRMEMYVWDDRKILIGPKMQVPILKSTLSGQVIFSPK